MNKQWHTSSFSNSYWRRRSPKQYFRVKLQFRGTSQLFFHVTLWLRACWAKQSYSDFPLALNMFVCGQVQRSSSSPSIHPCLTCLSSCVRKSTHRNHKLYQWIIFIFPPNLKDPSLQSWPFGKVHGDFQNLQSCFYSLKDLNVFFHTIC